MWFRCYRVDGRRTSDAGRCASGPSRRVPHAGVSSFGGAAMESTGVRVAVRTAGAALRDVTARPTADAPITHHPSRPGFGARKVLSLYPRTCPLSLPLVPKSQLNSATHENITIRSILLFHTANPHGLKQFFIRPIVINVPSWGERIAYLG